MEWILEYYGAKDPKGLIEGGLMYAVALDTAQRFKPYGTPDMAEHVPTTANPTALSEMEGTAPAQHKPASVTADDSLDALLDW